MSSKSDKSLWDSAMIVAGIIGGALIGAELIKAFGKKKIVYSCPKCERNIEPRVEICPYCKSHLSWDE